MADYNIFPEDICLAFKGILSSPTIEVPDEDSRGKRVNTIVSPKYIDPESELTKATYPSLVLYETTVTPDYSRMTKGDVIRDNPVYDGQGKLVSVATRPHPIPFTVTVDIRAYTKFNQQRDMIRAEIYRRFPSPFNYIIVKGVPLSVTCFPEQALLNVSSGGDGVEGTERKRTTMWRFQVATFFDLAARSTYSVVRDVVVNVTQGG